MIIDFHTHTFPDAIAASTLTKLSDCSGVKPLYDGTAAGLSAAIRECGADYGVVLSIATNQKQQQNVNNFAAQICRQTNLIGFGSVYPMAENAHDELERIKSLGIIGIKLHPDYQNFFVDDLSLIPLYRHIAKLGLITVFHTGSDIGISGPVHCTPEKLAAALPHFDGAPVVAAHFGGFLYWDEAERHLVGRDCYLDTAYTFGRIPLPQAKHIVETHGADRILFGSDMPWSGTDNEMYFIESMHLPEADKNAILGGNAQKLLNL